MSGRTPDEPVRLPATLQTWADLTFLHWRVDADLVQALLPVGLEVQLVDGSAWIGVTPFHMRDVRVPGVPPLGSWSRFPEVNVRTYVRARDGTDGLWFLSLVCPRRAVVLALSAVGLPYVAAPAGISRRGAEVAYRFLRPAGRGPLFSARVEVGRALTPAERTPALEALTGRWNAYTLVGGRLLRVPVEHEPWPLHAAEIVGGASPTGLLGLLGTVGAAGPPAVHFSPGVHARVGLPVRVR